MLFGAAFHEPSEDRHLCGILPAGAGAVFFVLGFALGLEDVGFGGFEKIGNRTAFLKWSLLFHDLNDYNYCQIHHQIMQAHIHCRYPSAHQGL